MTALGVLCCFALFVCLTLLASFFLPSHLSFKNTYTHTHTHTHTHAVVAFAPLEYFTSEAKSLVVVCAAVVEGSLLENLVLTLTTVDDTAISNSKPQIADQTNDLYSCIVHVHYM